MDKSHLEESSLFHETRFTRLMCSPDTVSIIVIIVMAVSGCCGVCVWISMFVGCTYLLLKYCKSLKHGRSGQRRRRIHERSDHDTHPSVPPRPQDLPIQTPTAPILPIPVFMPVSQYSQATLMAHPMQPGQATLTMAHPMQPMAGGNWIPSIDETNATLYRNRELRHTDTILSGSIQQSNPLYCDEGERERDTHAHHHNPFNTGGHVISNHQELTNINDESNGDDSGAHHNSFHNGDHVIPNHPQLTSINESDAEFNSPPPYSAMY